MNTYFYKTDLKKIQVLTTLSAIPLPSDLHWKLTHYFHLLRLTETTLFYENIRSMTSCKVLELWFPKGCKSILSHRFFFETIRCLLKSFIFIWRSLLCFSEKKGFHDVGATFSSRTFCINWYQSYIIFLVKILSFHTTVAKSKMRGYIFMSWLNKTICFLRLHNKILCFF